MGVIRKNFSIGLTLAIMLLCSGCLLSSATDLPNTPEPSTNPPLLTPTPVAPEPLPDAASALHLGDYDSARTHYTAAINSAATKCAALYGLGVTDLAANQAADANAVLTRALTECPPTFRAYVQRGEARRTLHQAVDAISDYQAALKLAPGLLDSYLYERMALAAGAGTADQLKYLQMAANAPRYLAGVFSLRDQIARLALAANDPTDAVGQYDLILAQAIEPEYRASVEIEAGNALLQVAQNSLTQTPTPLVPPTAPPGQLAAALVRYKLVITNYPDSPAALPALIALINNNQPVDVVLRTRINATHGNYVPVVSYLPDYLRTTPANQIPATLYFWLGQSERGIGQTADALSAFQKVRDAYPADPLASQAALEQGETQFAAKNYPAAINAYLAATTAYPNSPEAPEALWRAATIANNSGDPTQAITIFDQLGTRYPAADQAKAGLFTAGMLIAPTDPKRAASFFGRTGEAHGLLWQGKLLAKSGDPAGAKQAWSAAEANAPGTFFSWRAHDLLNNLVPYRPAKSVRFPTATDAERIAAESWLQTTFKLPDVSIALSAELAREPMLLRGTELWALGWQAEARAEFDALYTAKRDDPLALYQLANYYNGIGATSPSLIAASRIITLSKQSPTAAPAFIARLAYPIGYRDALLAAVAEFKIDPLYFASLIRLESDFDPQAHSVSDARGLTQIVPSTAQDIVGHLGWPPNYAVADLYRPQISLRLGAYYVDFVRRFLGDNPPAVLAGYNAGPGRAQGWLAHAGGDIDQLYEIIDDTQAQAYIRYTYEYDEAYRTLYGG